MNAILPLSVIIAVGALTVGCASQPEESVQPGDAATASVEEGLKPYNPGSEVTCRMVQVTGSHMYRKQCYTKAEKEQMQKDAHDWMLSRGQRGGTTRVRDELDPRERDRYETD